MKINSFAKINLGIEVLGDRPDGYHDILTLFQSIDLADSLEFSPSPNEGIVLSGDDPAVPWDERNLVHRAASLLQSRTGCRRGSRISVRKSIPAGKGLGGGSSNAAMTLLGLDEFWALGLGAEGLTPLARELGADVPYFLQGGLCLGEDRGDRLTRLEDLEPLWVLLAFPPFAVSTAEIYGAFRPSSPHSPTPSPGFAGTGDEARGSGSTPHKPRPRQDRDWEARPRKDREVEGLTSEAKPSKIGRFLESKDFGLLENQLEETIFRTYPQLEKYKRFFQDQGAEASLVSGTGSTVFGLFREEEKAVRVRKALRKKVPARLVETLPGKAYGRRLRAGA
jgi:4-diphosphocytidyl-2-C-methyl-D-erythritol kinase